MAHGDDDNGRGSTTKKRSGRKLTLAEQLKRVKLEPRPLPAPPCPELKAEPPRPEPEPEPLSDEDLFARAVDDMAPRDVFAGKFQGEVDGLPPRPESSPETGERPDGEEEEVQDEEAARRAMIEARDFVSFAREVGRIEPLEDRGKYYEHKPRRPRQRETEEGGLEPEEPRPYSSEPSHDMVTPPLPKSGEGLSSVGPLDEAQRALLDRFRHWARRNAVEEINLRGDTVEDALRQLELFVHQRHKAGDGFVRVIHGRGLGSPEGASALKPAVLHWLEGPGFRYVRGYIPERTPGGDYGSLVIELMARPAPKNKKNPRRS